MSYGRCCITSDIRENLELEKGHGLCFKNKDADDLAKVMKKALKEKSNVRKIGQKAKKYVSENHSWDKIADMTEKIYERINK